MSRNYKLKIGSNIYVNPVYNVSYEGVRPAGTKHLFTLENSSKGMVLSTEIFDEKGHLIARVIKNKIEFVCEKFEAHGVIEQGLGFMIKGKKDGKILFNARTTKEGYAAVTGTFYAGNKKIYVTDEVLRINDESQENVNFVSTHGSIYSDIGDINITSHGVKIPMAV